MATHAHCIACFDTLYAELVKRPLTKSEVSDRSVSQQYHEAKKNWRPALSLDEVEKSWSLYKSLAEKKLPALERLLQKSSSGSGSESNLSGSSTPSSAVGSGSGSSSEGGSAVDTPATSTTSLPDSEPIMASPLFVTWDIQENGSKELRGCIGTFETLSLAEGLPNYALISAFDDQRFQQMRFSELESLVVSVTLLTDFERCVDWQDWEVGTHGIKIRFRASAASRYYSATYLPQVALEQRWDHEQTLSSLIRKAGWHGSRDSWKSLDIETTRYQGKKVDLSWKEYKAWREWADSRGP